ncbi:MAG: hypothetical protein ABEJ05_09060 [Haloglomus sp.]
MTDSTDRIVVDINRDGPRSLAVPDAVTVDRSFTVELRNHGMATHVHLHLDDALSTVARLSNANVHVPSESSRGVQIHVLEPEDGNYEPVAGQLKVAIGYGQETRFVDLTVDLSSHEPVTVDSELAEPRSDGDGGGAAARRGPNSSAATGGPSPIASRVVRLLPAVVLGVVAAALAVAAVVSAGAPDFTLGGLAVGAAVLAAAYLLVT